MKIQRLGLLILLFAVGCSQLTVRRAENAPAAGAQVHALDSFLWGFAPGPRLPAQSELCPQGRIETLDFRMATPDVLLTLATLGIYVPHRVVVECSNQKN